ncbi:hypothetical protein DPEC_G00005250 [Dallia pectoralis]|uniref:Uncharacterized protein n=1 Tax=Dallia pectoralis TaxID=75939 RepID=A0ACC2HKQ2_DALPE|nr:hypothetical protein DPEC_G00005250 [Dallia pectoralis]
MIRSMLLNGRATLAKADAMGLSVLLVFTVIVSKSILQHILLNNEHCVLYHHATKVAYTACKRVRKVLSGTLDKVNIEMGHKRNLLFLSSLKPKETVRHYRKGQTKAKVVTGNYRTFTESVLVKDVERMNKHWIPMYNLYQPCAVSNDFIGSYEYLGSDANYVLRLRADNAYWRNWLGTLSVSWLPGAFRECCLVPFVFDPAAGLLRPAEADPLMDLGTSGPLWNKHRREPGNSRHGATA